MICIGTFLAYVVVYMYAPGSQGGRKRTSDPSELELEMVISHHIGDGTESGSYAGVTGNPSRPIIIIIV